MMILLTENLGYVPAGVGTVVCEYFWKATVGCYLPSFFVFGVFDYYTLILLLLDIVFLLFSRNLVSISENQNIGLTKYVF
jgi:hypothetical protein